MVLSYRHMLVICRPAGHDTKEGRLRTIYRITWKDLDSNLICGRFPGRVLHQEIYNMRCISELNRSQRSKPDLIHYEDSHRIEFFWSIYIMVQMFKSYSEIRSYFLYPRTPTYDGNIQYNYLDA